MPALQFKMKTTAKEILKQQKNKLWGKHHCAFCQHEPCTHPVSQPAVLEQAWPQARDYLLLQKREFSGAEECDKGRRECAGMETSLPVPPTLFLIIYLNQTSYWQLGQRAKARLSPSKQLCKTSLNHHTQHPFLPRGFSVLDSRFSVPLWEHKKNPPWSSKARRHAVRGTACGYVSHPSLKRNWKFCSSTVSTSLKVGHLINYWKTDSSGNIFMPLDKLAKLINLRTLFTV